MVESVLDPRKVFASVPALLYGIILLLDGHNTQFWFIALAGVLLGLLLLTSKLGYPAAALAPAFAGVFLLITCAIALVYGISDKAVLPFTGTVAELWISGIVAGAYIYWGVTTTRRALFS